MLAFATMLTSQPAAGISEAAPAGGSFQPAVLDDSVA